MKYIIQQKQEQTTDTCNNMMNLNIAGLGGRSQIPEATYCKIPLIMKFWKDKALWQKADQ